MIFSFTKNCPPGFKTGDQISPPGGYVGVGLQMQVDVRISPAGDVWVTKNWNDLNGATSPDPARPAPPRPGVEVRASRSSMAWLPRCSRRAWGWCGSPEAEGPQGGQFTIMKELTRP